MRQRGGSRYPPRGGTQSGTPPGGYPVRYPPWGGPGTPPGGYPVRYPPRGARYPPRGGTWPGTPPGGYPVRYPPRGVQVPPRGGTRSGTPPGGVPSQVPPRGGPGQVPPSGGVPGQDNRRSTHYTAGGMPLAFTQEDFLFCFCFGFWRKNFLDSTMAYIKVWLLEICVQLCIPSKSKAFDAQ